MTQAPSDRGWKGHPPSQDTLGERGYLFTEWGFRVGLSVELDFRVGFRVGFSSWTFELDFRVGFSSSTFTNIDIDSDYIIIVFHA